MPGRRASQPEPKITSLELDEIEEGVTELGLELSADDLSLSDKHLSFPGAIGVSLRISRALQSFNIGGAVAWKVAGECCRCLSPAEQELKASLQLLLQRREASDEELERSGVDLGVEIVAD